MSRIHRRSFLCTSAATAAGFLFSGPHWKAAAALRNKVKITDVKCMIVRGTWDWNLIKIETDQPGLYGIGEAYWGPGVKDLVLNHLKQHIIGEDPLNVDRLYTKMLMKSMGAGTHAGVTVTAASGIEIALWDLAGRILQTPVCNLLGGRFRDKVGFYRTNSKPLPMWKTCSPGKIRLLPRARRNGAGLRSNFRVTPFLRTPIPKTKSRDTIPTPEISPAKTSAAS